MVPGNPVDVAVGIAVAVADVEVDDSTAHQTGVGMAIPSVVNYCRCCMR